MKKVLIATKNEGKVKEYRELFAPYNVEVVSLNDYDDIPDIEETGETFAENAMIKAKTVSDLLKVDTIADDSGLVVPVLGGEPGIMSARYAGENATDQENIDKLLFNMECYFIMNAPAQFICAISICKYQDEMITVEGRCDGSIISEPVGENGFGYDSVFFSNEYNKTFAQISNEEKNKISHRAKAFNEMIKNIDVILG